MLKLLFYTAVRVSELVALNVEDVDSSGESLRVRGKGLPASNGHRGDLLVTVDVVVPRSLKKTQRKLLEDFGRTLESPRRRLDQMVQSAEATA